MYLLSRTSPRDVCRMSLVSTMFRSAADSDAIWEKFLPSDYHDIIVRSDDSSSMDFPTKKQLYLRLSDIPLLNDGGMKSFSLDKMSGKKCYMIAARDIYIVWSDTPEYWSWTPMPESRFSEVVVLLEVCWLEIRSKINTGILSPETQYVAYMIFKLTANAEGFESYPVEVLVKSESRSSDTQVLYLTPPHQYRPVPRRAGFFEQAWGGALDVAPPPQPLPPRDGDDQVKLRSDGWMEVKLGEYFNEGSFDHDLDLSLLEIKSGGWKTGLVIQGIEIRPKS